MKKIAVITPVEPANRERFAAAAPDCEITYLTPPDKPVCDQTVDFEKYKGALLAADAVLGQPPVKWLPEMKNLRWLQLAMAGAEPFSHEGVLKPDVALTCCSGAYGEAISEYMLACTLALIKKLHLYRDNMAKHVWHDRGEVRSISDMSVLCVGLGDIGGRYARLCALMGAAVDGVRRAGTSKPDCVRTLYHMAELDGIIGGYDIVALSLPNTPETFHLMDRERLAKLKRGAILLNVGRGCAVDGDALCGALESGALSGAALDVTEREPLPPDSRLWDEENLILTPHVSGFFHLRKTYDNVISIMADNLRRFAAGEGLTHLVDRSTGYKKTEN